MSHQQYKLLIKMLKTAEKIKLIVKIQNRDSVIICCVQQTNKEKNNCVFMVMCVSRHSHKKSSCKNRRKKDPRKITSAHHVRKVAPKEVFLTNLMHDVDYSRLCFLSNKVVTELLNSHHDKIWRT